MKQIALFIVVVIATMIGLVAIGLLVLRWFGRTGEFIFLLFITVVCTGWILEHEKR